MSSSRKLLFALIAGVVMISACGGDDDTGDAAVESNTTEAPPEESDPDDSPSGLAEAIAGDVSWGWEAFRDRATANPEDPELPQMQHVFVVDGEVWAEGRTDPLIGEDSEPVTAVIDPETREFELFDTPGFGQAVVHDGVMWGFASEERTISTFTPDTGATDPVVVPEVAALLDATTTSGPISRFVSLSDGRLLLQVHRTIFELDPDEPGAVLSRFDAGALFPQFDEFAQFHGAAAGDQVLYDWYGERAIFIAAPDDQPTAIDSSDGPQAEVLSSVDSTVWHRGSDLIVLDPATGQTETKALTGAPSHPPTNAVHWDAAAVSHLGDDNNPALHIAGAPDGVLAATAKRDEVVLVDMESGAMAAIGHLFGDIEGHRPLIVGDEVWLWSYDGQGIGILTFGPPLADGEGPDVVGESDGVTDATANDDLADDPDYRSGRQQGRWAAEADLEDGWPADNDPDNYDPDASPEFKAGYVDGYDDAYAVGGADGDQGGTTDEPTADDECEPGQSLEECYG